MKIRLDFALSLCLLFTFFLCASATLPLPQAWNKLVGLRSQNLVGTLTPSLARELLFRAPRNYSLVIFLTGPPSKCQVCKVLDKPFQGAAIATPGTSAFFFRADFTENKDIVDQLRIQQVPAILHIPPSENSIALAPQDAWQLSYDTLHPDNLLEWLSERVGYTISRPYHPYVLYGGTIFGSIAVIILARAIIFAVFNPRHPYLWFFFALVLFFGCQAGFIWNTIRKPQWIGNNYWEDKTMFILPQHGQFVVEGLIIGAIQVGIVVLLVGMLVIIPRFGKVSSRVLFYPSLALLGCLLYVLSHLYCFKNHDYPYCANWVNIKYEYIG